ncbi:flagella synthesis protein FlgN [Rhodanobacter denitrificans]|uniref:flagella synthesis protein FlgN n=1 Tax=Rhodanobacter denitrificans TaxID=666685 RepID=UPI001F350D11|nr:flagellar protein FlgN [Rhodanobacter denitrificans]UJJ57609.1 flagellar protein FlgN [Rhodanobacter denitrificans]
MNRRLQHELDDALAAVLGDMQQAVDRLAQVLESERSALDASDSDALDQAGTRKQALMLQLEQLDAERQQLASEQPAVAAAAAAGWSRIVQRLQYCHLLNQRNGSVVSQRLNQTRRALAVLTGHAGDNELYGRSGELQASLRSQVLAAV